MFSIYLPAHAASAVVSDALPQRADLTGDGSILLVEDEVQRDKQDENPASIKMRTRGWRIVGRA